MDSLVIGDKSFRVEGQLVRIARPEADKYRSVDDPELIVHQLRQSPNRIDLLTFMQTPPETSPKFSYAMEWDNLAVLPISTFDDWWTKQIGYKVRNRARKADTKGVIVREIPFDDALLRGIVEIYNECPVRQGRPFRHYGATVESLRKVCGSFLEDSMFIGAFLGDKLVGFVKLVADETHTLAGMMHIMAMIQHREKAVTNALLAHAVRTCAERTFAYLVYSSFPNGSKYPDGISSFKQHHGFQRVQLPRYYIPFTHLGSAALRLGLHHRLLDRLPDSLARRLRSVRGAWYNRRFRAYADSVAV